LDHGGELAAVGGHGDAAPNLVSAPAVVSGVAHCGQHGKRRHSSKSKKQGAKFVKHCVPNRDKKSRGGSYDFISRTL
jgi:hypothetical protein